VKKDPLEVSYRKILNFGHTVGHAIESYSMQHDKKPLKHGEAVAIGIICEAYLSKILLDLSNKDLREIVGFMSQYFPKYSLRTILSPELISIMRQDKKNENEDSINFTLLRKIGKGSINHVCSESQIAAALNYYDSL
jgi:3-dehydroquinate synthase